MVDLFLIYKLKVLHAFTKDVMLLFRIHNHGHKCKIGFSNGINIVEFPPTLSLRRMLDVNKHIGFKIDVDN